MTMRPVQRYRCLNPACRGEVELVLSSTVSAGKPRCDCGCEMKKFYTKPTLRDLGVGSASVFFVGQGMKGEQL